MSERGEEGNRMRRKRKRKRMKSEGKRSCKKQDRVTGRNGIL